MNKIKYWAIRILWLLIAITPTIIFLDVVCDLVIRRDHGNFGLTGFAICQTFFAEIYARKYFNK